MLGLYIHIPFCKQRCAYCHFDIKVFHPQTDSQVFYKTYLESVSKEIETVSTEVGSRQIDTIFYGGGTPSRLGLEHLTSLHQKILTTFQISETCEVSMEVNPEDASPILLQGLHDLGINRLSLGIQTFEDDILTTLRRAHNRQQALQAIGQMPTFDKGLSLDLMLGLPGQTTASLQRDLDLITDIDPQHLALYMLERDLPTPIDKLAQQHRLPDEDQQADFYMQVSDFLISKGYEHYEISNFSKPGFACRHNLNYWLSGDYLGIGPAAHGRLGNTYIMNHGKLQDYVQAVKEQGHGQVHREVWTQERIHQEQFIQALRLTKGVQWALVSSKTRSALQPFIKHGLLVRQDEHLALSLKGRLLANEVFAVFLDEEQLDHA